MRCAILPVYCSDRERRSAIDDTWISRLAGAVSAYYRAQSGGREPLPCTAFGWRQIGLTAQQWVDAGMLAGRLVIDEMVAAQVLSRNDFDHFVILIDHELSQGGVTPHEAPETSLVAAVGVNPALVAHELGHRFGAEHTYREGPDGPIGYGGPFCIMGGEGSKHSFDDPTLDVPGEGSGPANQPNGPGLCFINLVRAGWADMERDARRLQPFADGRFGVDVRISALDGAPPPDRPSPPVACLIEDGDRYVVEFRSATSFYDQAVPHGEPPNWGEIVVYRTPAEGAPVALQVGTLEARPGEILSLGSQALAQRLARKTGGRAGQPLKIVVMSVDPGGRSVGLRVEKVPGRAPQYFGTEGLLDFMQWGLSGRRREVEDRPVLNMLLALAEIEDLGRLKRVAGPRDAPGLEAALRDRIGDLRRMARRLRA